MLNFKNKNTEESLLGKLELVDREIFFIAFNTRDT